MALINLVKRNKILILLPLAYAIGICVYIPPPDYDLVRFYHFYSVFRDFELSSLEVQNIFRKRVDYISPIWLLFIAKVGLPMVCFLFPITYITVFNFLYVFRSYYQNIRNKVPPNWTYFIVFCTISIPAVFSGVRNIHALSFVALALVLIRKNNKHWALVCLLYAGLFHYSTYLYLFVYGFYLLFNQLDVKKYGIKYQMITCLIISGLTLLIKVTPSTYLETLLPHGLFLKLDFYLKETDILIREFLLNNRKYVVLNILYSYELLFLFVILLFRKFRINVYWGLIFIPCILTLFYPNIFSRYAMLVNIAITMFVLTKKMSLIKKKILIVNVLFIFVIQFVLFFNYIMKFQNVQKLF
ncbi:hypothetical protein D1Z97_07720 [Riemerella anatipestifer]|uniref:EpsG family protein n=1 Tax=Riemerella anatipestifer TaxID=34085 RepID=UPI00129EA34F|nr:EpsG family protein [Riemerella anatipestifer]MRN01068.1 hypothetical protein [Riemerella anatipestifer]